MDKADGIICRYVTFNEIIGSFLLQSNAIKQRSEAQAGAARSSCTADGTGRMSNHILMFCPERRIA